MFSSEFYRTISIKAFKLTNFDCSLKFKSFLFYFLHIQISGEYFLIQQNEKKMNVQYGATEHAKVNENSRKITTAWIFSQLWFSSGALVFFFLSFSSLSCAVIFMDLLHASVVAHSFLLDYEFIYKKYHRNAVELI